MNVSFGNPETVAAPQAGGYSHAARLETGDTVLLFVSGQLALDPDGVLVGGGDMRAQTERVFENLREILSANGATFADVVKISSFVTDMSDLSAIREVRRGFLAKEPPASTLVQVAGLAVAGAMIEVELVAAFPVR
jgi:2-iminobutanoate/2-iminopropanoate deaminase